MSEIKWIKLFVEMFDHKKIKFIRKNIPAGNDISLIWCMLLCLAGKCNAGGYIFLTENIPYTEEMLANELDFQLNTVKLALETLIKLKMLAITEQGFYIEGWNEYQSLDKMEEIREQNRIRKQRQREKQKLLTTGHVTITGSHATDIEEDKEIEYISPNGDSRQEIVDPIPQKVTYKEFVKLFTKNCPSLPKVKELNKSRKDKIKARWKEHPDLYFWSTIFEEIEASDFLTGRSGKWQNCNFDWIIKNNTNYAKVLEGTYTNKKAVNPESKEEKKQPAYHKHVDMANKDDFYGDRK